ncbi:MAG TPA: carbohydrate porin [Rhodanobacter sp.]
MKKILVIATAAWLSLGPTLAHGDDAPLYIPQWLGAQYTFIDQHQSSLHAPYSGPLSLHAQGDTERSHSFGAYFGVALPARLQFYFDVEMFKGEAVSGATGLGGFANGDVVHSGGGTLSKTAYVARRYLRWTLPLGGDMQPQQRAQGQLPDQEAPHRIEIKLGKMAVSDDFDKNRYADAARTQFLNWSLLNNTAWDFAADTRGYTEGLMLGWINPVWSLRYGVYRMPTQANGTQTVDSLRRARGEQLELTLQPVADGGVLRLLAFRNIASMGIYRSAIAIALAEHSTPDIHADDRAGRRKYGFAANGELPLADDGNTGLFARAGWNDGRTESFAYTEVDRTVSGGAQVSGTHWGRPADILGLAMAVDALSPSHRDYLALGGEGFTLGDGALNYGRERILEAYYNLAVVAHLTLGPDFQLIHNPGYNRDRGPARFVGMRMHVDM